MTITPNKLLCILNAASFEMKHNHPNEYSESTKQTLEILLKHIWSINWDDYDAACIMIDEVPF